MFATAVMVLHFAVLAFIVLGGLLAWRWPRVLYVHVPFLLWGLGIVFLDLVCPLTELENHLRGAAGYEDGFLARYLDGVLYPENYLVLSRVFAGLLVVVSYVGVFVRLRRRSERVDRQRVS